MQVSSRLEYLPGFFLEKNSIGSMNVIDYRTTFLGRLFFKRCTSKIIYALSGAIHQSQTMSNEVQSVLCYPLMTISKTGFSSDCQKIINAATLNACHD
jgi:hypothetical protein